MKVDIVEFVENEMVELDVAQIGSNWGWVEVECGYENDYDGDECGDKGGDACGVGHGEFIKLPGIPFNTKLPSLHPLPNQSKPTVSLLSFSPITFSYNLITFSYNF